MSSSLNRPHVAIAVSVAAVVVAIAAIVRRTRSSKSCCSSSSSSLSAYTTAGADPRSNPYETIASVHEYLLMHYGTVSELVNFPSIQSAQLQSSINFPRECAELCGKYAKLIREDLGASGAGRKLRALDVGCSVGRSSFEMTRFVDEVIGLDYSQAFVDAANELKKSGSSPYSMRTEGDLKQHAVAVVDPALDRSRVRFVQGDATSLSLDQFDGRKFDLVLAANLLCRLPTPRLFLDAMGQLIAPGGYLVMPSPYTWLEQYTPKSEWMGGYVDAKSGKDVKSFDAINLALTDQGKFALVQQFDMPFFIRETARKNQWSVSHVTIWKRTNKE